MAALWGSVVASITAQLHGYVVRETALSCQKYVSSRLLDPNRAEMSQEASIAKVFTIVPCSRNVYNISW